MYIIPKTELIDGKYYEGVTRDLEDRIVAKYDSNTGTFVYRIHIWHLIDTSIVTYWDEQNEYYDGFYPTSLTEPADYQVV